MIELKQTIQSVADVGAESAYTHFMRTSNDHDTWIQDSDQDPIDNKAIEAKLQEIADKLLSIFPDSDFGSITIMPDKNKVKINLFYKNE